MPSPTGNLTPTSILTIANLLREHVTLKGVCTPDQFIITTLKPEEVPLLQTAYDLVFRVGGEDPGSRVIDGAGRSGNLRIRRPSLSVRTRVLLDAVGQDATHLLDPGIGQVQLEDSIFNALETFVPIDEPGNALVTEPIRLGRLSDSRRIEKFPEWIVSTVEIEVSYCRILDATSV